MKCSLAFALFLALQPAIVSCATSSDCKKEVPARYSCVYCGPGSEDIDTINCNYGSAYYCTKDCYCNTLYDDPDLCFYLSDADDGLSGGAVAGIVIVVLLLLGATGGCVWFMYKKKAGCFKDSVITPTQEPVQSPQIALSVGSKTTTTERISADGSKTITKETVFPDGSKEVMVTKVAAQ